MKIERGEDRPELLAPAASLEVLKVAIRYGANAVYIGGESYGLRAKAKNFSREEMAEGIRFAHAKGARVYVTVNILAHEADLSGVEEYLKELAVLSPDALIIADPGIFLLARQFCPEIDIHISTQANNTNSSTARFWHTLGAKRIVTARELSLEEIRQMRANIPPDLELETFIHGAMCISYSGRCLLSSFLSGRDANQGACTHPCRWRYALMEETRPGEYMPVEENERGTFLYNSKDLCMADHVDDLMESGIDSFKIEGRMKNALYVATVVRAYRLAMDDYQRNVDLYRQRRTWYLDQVEKCTYRPHGTGFFYGRPGQEGQIYGQSTYESDAVYLGYVEEVDGDGLVHLTQKNKFEMGDTIEIMKPDGTDLSATVLAILNEEGVCMPSAPHAKQPLALRLSAPAEPFDVLRKI